MKLENLTIEKAIDNELNIGSSICIDDVIDNSIAVSISDGAF